MRRRKPATRRAVAMSPHASAANPTPQVYGISPASLSDPSARWSFATDPETGSRSASNAGSSPIPRSYASIIWAPTMCVASLYAQSVSFFRSGPPMDGLPASSRTMRFRRMNPATRFAATTSPVAPNVQSAR